MEKQSFREKITELAEKTKQNEAVLTPGVDQSYDNVLRVTMAWVTVS